MIALFVNFDKHSIFIFLWQNDNEWNGVTSFEDQRYYYLLIITNIIINSLTTYYPLDVKHHATFTFDLNLDICHILIFVIGDLVTIIVAIFCQSQIWHEICLLIRSASHWFCHTRRQKETKIVSITLEWPVKASSFGWVLFEHMQEI